MTLRSVPRLCQPYAMPPADTRAASTSASERVALQIKNAIRAGRLAPGQRLTEALLTAEFRVSRGPLREAMRRLEVDGVLSFQKNRGVSVRRLTRDDFVHLLELREAHETLAARLLVRSRRAGETIAELVALFEQMEAAMQRGDLDRYNVGLYVQFHNRLVEGSDNPVLVRHFELLNLDVLRLQFRPLVDLELVRAAHVEHARLLEALADRSAARAEKAARKHIAHFTEHVRRLPDRVFREAEAPPRRTSRQSRA